MIRRGARVSLDECCVSLILPEKVAARLFDPRGWGKPARSDSAKPDDGGSGLFFRVLRNPLDQAAAGAAEDHVGRLADPLRQVKGGLQGGATALADAGGSAGRSIVIVEHGPAFLPALAGAVGRAFRSAYGMERCAIATYRLTSVTMLETSNLFLK
jgi:hypothetical protein